MSPFVHGLIAWLIAILFLGTVRDRRLVVIIGVMADIDGVFILFNRDLYLEYHHTFGHSFVLGIPLVLVLAAVAKERGRFIAAGLAAFSMHIVADIVGTNWTTYPFYPASDMGFTVGDHLSNTVIYGMIAPVTFILVLVALFVVAYYREVSPIEFFSVKWDRRWTGEIVIPLKYKCEVCGERAALECETCERKVCREHAPKPRRYTCLDCRGKVEKNA